MKKITLNDLTIDEKLRLLSGKDCWHVEDLGGKLPEISVSDGPVGLRKVLKVEDGKDVSVPAVAYPSISVLANTWSEDCARTMGDALADDCIENDVDVLLAPGVNIKRSPLNGRNFEYFSEDPYLAGILARSYIEGVQTRGVGTCIKHYLANNLEYDRLHQSSDIDERTLREIYYKPFEIAFSAKPVSMMCSYNRINGVYASENKKGFTVAREELGFDGAIMSDWGAVRNPAECVKAGLDLEMPYNEENHKKLTEDYKAGKISLEEVDVCVQRMLDFIYKVKEMRSGCTVKKSLKERTDVSKKVAEEGIILLKNNGILPLSGDENISVCGCYAKPDEQNMVSGGGSARVNAVKSNFDLPECIAKLTKGKVAYEGAFRIDGVASWCQEARIALSNSARSDINIVCVGTGSSMEYEGGDRQKLRLADVQERAIMETAEQNPETVVIIFAGGAVDVSPWEECVAGIIFAGFPGMCGDEVLADILFGKINPSGKTSETFAVLEDYPSEASYMSAGVTRYAEGLDVGYRYFDSYNVPVNYPFGYGLSYSSFLYSDLKLKAEDGNKLSVSYRIENVSDVDGKEISQVYVRECAPLVYRPYKELKAFSKDMIKAGKSKTITIMLDKSAFAYYSVAKDCWTVDDGVYEIIAGPSCDDEALYAKILIEDGKISVL